MRFATNKILLLLFCTSFYFTNAQNNFTSYSKEEGLSSSTILFTFLDSKGIIWAATNNGINAFTGKNWVSINSIEGNNGNKQYLGKILKVFESSNTDLWISTEKGIFHFNRKYWTHFSDHDNKEFAVKLFFEDIKQNIWVLLEKDRKINDAGELGFSFVEGRMQMYNGYQWYDFPGMIGGSATVITGEPKEYFTSIILASNNDIWVTSLDGLYNYNGRKWTEYNEEHLPSDRCHKVIETSNNKIWVATANGIAKQNGEEWIKYEKTKGIKDNLPYDFFEDGNNRLWTFTRKDHKFKSLCYFENKKWISCFNKDIHIKGQVTELIELNHEIIAFSSKGLSLFRQNSWENFEKLFGLKDDKFKEIIKSKNNSVTFTGQQGLYKLGKNGLETIYSPSSKWRVTSLLEASNGDIWLGTEKLGLFRFQERTSKNYNTNNGLIDHGIISIFEDMRKNIWVITKNGISLFNKNQ
jgi:ligand-binding sensor domain-containing protein